MWLPKYKILLLGAAITWTLFVVYLFVSVNKIGESQSDLKLNVAVKWATDLFKNYSGNYFNYNISSNHLHSDNSSQFQQEVQILMSADENVLGGLIAAVNSVVRHTNHKNVHFYFIIPASIEPRLRKWMAVDSLQRANYTLKRLPDTEYKPYLAKALFLKYFPNLEGKIVYLDSDVIVQGDITELSNTEVTDGTFGAFSEECHAGSNRLGINRDNRYAGKLNLKNKIVKKVQKDSSIFFNPSSCAFSTGVFVTSRLDIWRKANITGTIEELLQADLKETILGPQGGNDPAEAAMLVGMYKKITKLDPIWHVRNLGITTGSRYSSKFLEEAKLLHWNGHFKPWSRRGPEQSIWNKYFVKDPAGIFKPIRKN